MSDEGKVCNGKFETKTIKCVQYGRYLHNTRCVKKYDQTEKKNLFSEKFNLQIKPKRNYDQKWAN